MRTLIDPTGQTSEQHVETITEILGEFGESVESIEFMTSDNTNTNPKIARITRGLPDPSTRVKPTEVQQLTTLKRIPFIGCYSHKLNLAIQFYCSSVENVATITKVHDLMVYLRTNNNWGTLKTIFAKLGTKPLHPLLRAETRWSSTYVMLARFDRMIPALYDIDWNDRLEDYLLTRNDKAIITRIRNDFEAFEKANKALQEEHISLAKASEIWRLCRLDLQKNYRDQDDADKEFIRAVCTLMLPSEHEHILFPIFEEAVVKIQSGAVALTTNEQSVVRRFSINESDTVVPEEPNGEEEEEDDKGHSAQADINLKRQRLDVGAEYKPLAHVAATSNIVERLFSRAGWIFDDRRRAMKKSTLEMILFLFVNRLYWDCFPSIIDEIKASSSAVLATNESDDEEM
jgi:hypothetical protein